MTIVVAKRWRIRPSASDSPAISASFDSTRCAASVVIVSSKVALNAGSSKHGKARRAWVASNWVTPIQWGSPSISVRLR